ncbi:hypothetical protein SNEBB_007973 [Seison nebaliae]|nr:hypothetical protein SNEBB_007973 [Seison nebaliae]
MNGVYRFTARNNYGVDIINLFLTIGGGVKPILQKVDHIFRLSKGTSFSLDPNLLADSAEITYIWSFNNNPSLPNGVKVNGKTISIVQVADNQLVVYKETNFPLIVHLRSGSESVTIQWKRNVQIIRSGLSSNNRQLILRNIQFNMGGLYTIIATNNYGKSTISKPFRYTLVRNGKSIKVDIDVRREWKFYMNT